jgi:putative ABC transport system ATP-binding protein
LHVLGGLVRPSSGTVARSTDRIGYVFQGSALLAHFTAFENLAFAAQVAEGEVDATLAPQALLELVGLAAKAESLPSELSGGEQQRVAIARALAQAPQLLLCDEPTGHLDSDTGERVLELIDALERELGFALVVATHDAGVAGHARRSVALVDGVVVSEAAPA